MDDAGGELIDDEAVDGVDVLTATSAESEVVKAGAVLVEGPAARRVRAAHQDAGAAADAVDGVLVADERLHADEVAELLPERDAAFGVVDRELDVSDAVELDRHRPLLP